MTESDVQPVNYVASWDDAHRYSPAPRHRRRLILNQMKRLPFADCLDAGCAQPHLIDRIVRDGTVQAFGCDLSADVIRQNRQRFPHAQFEQFDLSAQAWPGDRQFDLVICSEVLEHIPDWESAVRNLARMTRRYLLITVPGGKVHRIDRHIGHLRHFRGPEIVQAIQGSGLGVRTLRRWGFPFHSLYKYAINGIASDRIYASFGERRYGLGKRFVSGLVHLLFYANDVFPWGSQLLILAERAGTGPLPGAAGGNP